MKKTLVLLLALLPIASCGQHLKCCKTKNDIETYLTGIWKQDDSNPEFLYGYENENETKTKVEFFYEYTFEYGQGYLTEMIKIDGEDEYKILENHPFVNIVKYEQGFKLIFTDLSGNLVLKLKHLSKNKMILVKDEKEIEFIKKSK